MTQVARQPGLVYERPEDAAPVQPAISKYAAARSIVASKYADARLLARANSREQLPPMQQAQPGMPSTTASQLTRPGSLENLGGTIGDFAQAGADFIQGAPYGMAKDAYDQAAGFGARLANNPTIGRAMEAVGLRPDLANDTSGYQPDVQPPDSIAGQLGRGVGSVGSMFAASALTGGTAAFALPLVAGAQSLGATYQDARQRALDMGANEQQAHQIAAAEADTMGLVSTVTSLPVGKALGAIAPQALVRAVATANRGGQLGQLVRTAVAEGSQEAAEEVAQMVLQRVAEDDPAAFQDWQRRIAISAGAGALGGGIMAGAEAVGGLPGQRQAPQDYPAQREALGAFSPQNAQQFAQPIPRGEQAGPEASVGAVEQGWPSELSQRQMQGDTQAPVVAAPAVSDSVAPPTQASVSTTSSPPVSLSPSQTTPELPSNLSSLTLAELRSLDLARGGTGKGTKAALVKRLTTQVRPAATAQDVGSSQPSSPSTSRSEAIPDEPQVRRPQPAEVPESQSATSLGSPSQPPAETVAREPDIEGSILEGNVHLHRMPKYVESLRGKKIRSIRDGSTGKIMTVANTGDVVVWWDNEGSAQNNLANKKSVRVKGKRKPVDVWESWVGPSDQPDFVVEGERRGPLSIQEVVDRKVVVQRRLAQGRPVPQEVLNDYPDLKAKYAQETKAEPSKAPIEGEATPQKVDDLLRSYSDQKLSETETFIRNRIDNSRGKERDNYRVALKSVAKEARRRKFQAASLLSDEEWLKQTRFYASRGTKNAELPSGQVVMLKKEATASNFREVSRDFLLMNKPKKAATPEAQAPSVAPDVVAPSEAMRVADKVAKAMTQQQAASGFAVSPEGFSAAWMILEDADKVAAARELANRGLLPQIYKNKRTPESASKITDTVAKTLREMHSVAKGNRTEAFSESAAYKKAMGESAPVAPDVGRAEGAPRGAVEGVAGVAPSAQKITTTDTRDINSATWYHGTGKAGLTAKALDPILGSHESLFGHGIYLTDNADVAGGYAKARGKSTQTPTVYKASVNIDKVLDLNKPLPPDAVAAIKSADPMFAGDVEMSSSKPGSTGESVISDLRRAIAEYSKDNGVPTSEFVGMFQDIAGKLKEAGYDALTHIGGGRVGKVPHRVLILLDPNGSHTNAGRVGQVTRFEPATHEPVKVGQTWTDPAGNKVVVYDVRGDKVDIRGTGGKLGGTLHVDQFKDFTLETREPGEGGGGKGTTPKDLPAFVDRTPEGYGPREDVDEAPDPGRLPQADPVQLQKLKNSINEAKSLLRGNPTPVRRAQIQGSLAKSIETLRRIEKNEPLTAELTKRYWPNRVRGIAPVDSFDVPAFKPEMLINRAAMDEQRENYFRSGPKTMTELRAKYPGVTIKMQRGVYIPSTLKGKALAEWRNTASGVKMKDQVPKLDAILARQSGAKTQAAPVQSAAEKSMRDSTKKGYTLRDVQAEIRRIWDEKGMDAIEEADAIEATGDPDSFTFGGPVPADLLERLDDEAARRLVRGNVKGGRGEETLARLGADGMADKIREAYQGKFRTAEQKLRKFVGKKGENDPAGALMLAIYDNWPAKDSEVPMTTLDPKKVKVGTTFTINGVEVEIRPHADGGYLVLKDGEDLPITPVDALNKIPVDKGSVKQDGSTAPVGEKKTYTSERKIEKGVFGQDRPDAFGSKTGSMFGNDAPDAKSAEDATDARWRSVAKDTPEMFGGGNDEILRDDGGDPIPFSEVRTLEGGRKRSDAQRIQPSPLGGKSAKNLVDIRLDLGKSLGVNVRTGKTGKAGGFYAPRSQDTVVKFSGDLDTMAHELGHNLDDTYGLVKEWAKDRAKSPFDSELIPHFSQYGSVTKSGPKSKLTYQRTEAVAEWLRAYAVNPEAAIKAAPKFAAHFEAKVPADIRAKIDAFGADIRRWYGANPVDQTVANIRMKMTSPTLWQRMKKAMGGQSGGVFKQNVGQKIWTQLVDDLNPLWSAISAAHELRGVDPSKILPSRSSKILVRTWAGVDRKIMDILQHGPIHTDGEKVKGMGGVDWLLEPIRQDGMTTEQVNKASNDVAAYAISKRLLDRTKKMEENAAKLKDLAKEAAELRAMLEKAAKDAKPGEMAGGSAVERLEEIRKQMKSVRGALMDYKGPVARVDDYVSSRMQRFTGAGAGIRSDVTVARETIERLQADPANMRRVSEAASRMTRWANWAIDYAEQSGRLSAAQAKAIRESDDAYVSFQRVSDPDEEAMSDLFSTAAPGSGRRLASVQKVSDRIKGSTRQIENPYVSLLSNTHRIVKEADRNRALSRVVSDFSIRRDMHDKAKDPINLSMFMREAKAGDADTTRVFVNGEAKYYQFAPEIHAALRKWGEESFTPTMLKPVRLAASVLRNLITSMPPFMVRNMIRDPISRGVLSRTGSTPAAQFQYLMKPSEFGKDLAELRRYGGGLFGNWNPSPEYSHKFVADKMAELAADRSTILTMPRKIATGASEFFEASESIGRLAEFTQAKKYAAETLGYSEADASLYAAFQARDLLDYSRAGSIIRPLAQYIPFLNASIQGLARTAQGAVQNPRSVAVKWAAYVLLPSLATYLYNVLAGDEEEYRDLPAWRRDFFMNFKVGSDTWLSIPKPFEMGVLASGVERSIDKMRGNKDALDNYVGSVWKGLVPVDESALSLGLRPAVEQLTNHDFFRDQYIVPPWEEKLDLKLRDGTTRASRLGQLVQDGIGLDARRVDHLSSSLFGTAGTVAQMMSDLGRDDKPDAGRRLGMYSTGLLRAGAGAQSLVARKAMSELQSRGLTGTKEYKGLIENVKAVANAKTPKERDWASALLRDASRAVLANWEGKPIEKKESAPKPKPRRKQDWK